MNHDRLPIASYFFNSLLEDGLHIAPGRLASSNAEQVTKIRLIIGELVCEIATPAEARAMLGLKGGDMVAF